jgi:PqqD family protein of HPr-rel-A system
MPDPMRSFVRADGVLVEPVGHLWAAFSPLSGETSLINDESAAVLEVLSAGPASSDAVCDALAGDIGTRSEDLLSLIEAGWPRLIEAGLVQELARGISATQ